MIVEEGEEFLEKTREIFRKLIKFIIIFVLLLYFYVIIF